MTLSKGTESLFKKYTGIPSGAQDILSEPLRMALEGFCQNLQEHKYR